MQWSPDSDVEPRPEPRPGTRHNTRRDARLRSRLGTRLRAWLQRRRTPENLEELEGEVAEEFRFHIEMKAASLEARGMAPEAARAAAEECFGERSALLQRGVRTLSRARQAQRRRSRVGGIVQDFRGGLLRLCRRPGYSLLAAGTLALGLSASTAVFTYINAYRQPFPGADVRNVFQVFQSSETMGYGPISYPDLLDLISVGEGQFQVVASGQPLFAASVRWETETDVIFGQGVTGNFFPVIRVEMSTGRGLSPDDDLPSAPPVVVISHEYWSRQFGRDPEVLGQTILLNNRPHTIVGVAGPSFLGSRSTFRPQVWLPFGQFKQVYWARSDTETSREVGAVSPYIKLRSDLSLDEASQILNVLASALDAEAPLADRTRRFILEPATWIHPSIRQAEAPITRIMLFAAAGLLLLACANVANLLLSSGSRRSQEMAVRAAIGASRWRLARQLLAENLLLSLTAGALALALAGPAANRLSSYFARPSVWGANVPRDISLDPGVLVFALAAALATGLLAGVVPAVRASTRSPAPALQGGGRWASEGRVGGDRWFLGGKNLLISIQVALSVFLLFVAGLVLRTLDSARHVDAGFDVEWTLASYVSTSSMGTPVSERKAFFKTLIQRFEALPWVRAAAVAENAPLSGHPVRALRPESSGEPIQATVAKVFPGYFEAMGMEILTGRAFQPADSSPAHGVVIVNESFAARLSDTGEALGMSLWWPAENDEPDRRFEIVGVARNARQTSVLQDPEPVAYFSFPQHYSATGNAFLLKVAGDPALAVQRMEQELRAVDPRIAIVNILPYRDVVEGFLYTQRMNAELFSIIALLGLALSAAGIFGVVNLAVARRRREIGVHLAVGAGPAAITRLVLSHVTGPLALGLVVGLAAALTASRIMDGLVWGISTRDPLALGAGASVLLAAVVLALLIPIRKALRIDPVTSLRTE